MKASGKEIKRLLKKWQAILGLSHWRITFKIKPRAEMGAEDCGACISVTLPRMSAHIEILRDEDWSDELMLEPHDPEALIIHELLHIYFEPLGDFKRGSRRAVAVEQAIEMLQRSLLALDRSGPASA